VPLADCVVRARDLVKTFKGRRAVDGISLSVGAGERVGLLGPNGAGKTTTLLMLIGVVTPERGHDRDRRPAVSPASFEGDGTGRFRRRLPAAP